MTRRQDVTEIELWPTDDDDDIPSNGSREPTIGEVIVARYSRRQALKGISAVAAVSAMGSMGANFASRPAIAESARYPNPHPDARSASLLLINFITVF